MGQTMAQRHERMTLVKACWELESLFVSTKEVTLQERDMYRYIYNKLQACDTFLNKADKEGKLSQRDRNALLTEDGTSNIVRQCSTLLCSMLDTYPLLQKLAKMDIFTDGKNFTVIHNRRGNNG